MRAGILANGKIIRLMGMENSITQMVMFIKKNGLMKKQMGVEHIFIRFYWVDSRKHVGGWRNGKVLFTCRKGQ